MVCLHQSWLASLLDPVRVSRKRLLGNGEENDPSVFPSNHSGDAAPLWLQAGSSVPALKVDTLSARQAGSPVIGGCVVGPAACRSKPDKQARLVESLLYVRCQHWGWVCGCLGKGPVLP